MIGILRHPEVAHLASDLFIRVVRIQQRIELRVEQFEKHFGAGRGVEDVVRAPLSRVRARLRKPHRVQPRERASGGALSDEQMLLRVRLALIGNRKRIHPGMRLRHRFNLQQIECEPAPAMDEPRADRFVGVVEIDGSDGETVDDLVFRELRKIDGGGGKSRHG